MSADESREPKGAAPGSEGQESGDVPFLAQVLDHIAQPVFVKDRQYRFVLVNRAFEDFTGKTRLEVLGRTDYDFFKISEADFFREVDQGIFATGQSAIIPEEPLTDDLGRVRKLRTVKTAIKGADGTVTHIVGVVTDLTEFRVSEEELRRAHGKPEQAALTEAAHQSLLRKERLAVLGQLAGGLAHQIRNPLAAMSTATAILLKRLGDSADPDVLQALAAIREEVREANRIITDLLDYARIRPASKERITIRALCDGVIEQLHVPPNVTLERNEDPGLEVLADERQLRDALSNLARNALEAMPTGGQLILSALSDGKDVVIAVEDTGPGLTRDVISRLFEPLVTSKPLGLGLGLTLARALVENQGGVLRAGTSRGGGARFEVRLALASE